MVSKKSNHTYGLSNPLQSVFPSPIQAQRSPTVRDLGYESGQIWVDQVSGQIFSLCTVTANSATWIILGTASGGDISTLTGDTGGAISPTSANVNILGGDGLTVNGSGSTLTINRDAEGGYPITPYVVGLAGQAGYTTIQAAIDAATAAGGTNVIWVQPGSYTEDLNITSSITFMSIDGVATITGIHTPPASGAVNFDGFVLISATHILSSAAAGSTVFNMNNTFVIITNGYIFNVPNWTGEILMDNCGEASTNDGVINNITGSSDVKLLNVEMGAGSGQTMQLNGGGGFLRFDTCNVNCPVNMVGTGSIFFQNGVKFANTVTIGGALTGFGIDTNFRGGANQALTYNSSGAFSLSNGEIQSTNNPAVGGTGAGILTLTSVAFPDNNDLAGTLTIVGGNQYSATYKADYTDGGLIVGQGALGNMIATSAGTDGQVILGASGADPDFATLTSTGTTIDYTPGANTLNLDVATQVATSVPTDAGTATPALGALTLAGGTNINTAGAGSTATVNMDAAVQLTSVSFDAGVNLLNFYEESVWTPVIEFGGASVGITYSAQNGNYIRIGSAVFVRFIILLTSKGTSVGNATVTGLPYTVADSVVWAAVRLNNVTLTGVHWEPMLVAGSGGTSIRIAENDPAAGNNNLADTAFSDNSAISLTGFYFV